MSNAQRLSQSVAAGTNPIPASSKGAANGVAGLGADGLVPNAQLPALLGAISGTISEGWWDASSGTLVMDSSYINKMYIVDCYTNNERHITLPTTAKRGECVFIKVRVGMLDKTGAVFVSDGDTTVRDYNPSTRRVYPGASRLFVFDGTLWVSIPLNNEYSLPTPSSLGTASTGVSWSYSLADHVHPNTISGLKEKKAVVSGSAIDLATANYFTKTAAGSLTWTVSNVPATDTSASFILDLTNGGTGTQTWWSGVKWAGGTAPTLTASGRDVLGFFTHDGGTTWTGLVLGKDVK